MLKGRSLIKYHFLDSKYNLVDQQLIVAYLIMIHCNQSDEIELKNLSYKILCMKLANPESMFQTGVIYSNYRTSIGVSFMTCLDQRQNGTHPIRSQWT